MKNKLLAFSAAYMTGWLIMGIIFFLPYLGGKPAIHQSGVFWLMFVGVTLFCILFYGLLTAGNGAIANEEDIAALAEKKEPSKKKTPKLTEKRFYTYQIEARLILNGQIQATKQSRVGLSHPHEVLMRRKVLTLCPPIHKWGVSKIVFTGKNRSKFCYDYQVIAYIGHIPWPVEE